MRKKGYEIKKKSSPLKLLSQSQPNFAEMILGWSSSKIVSGISEHRPQASTLTFVRYQWKLTSRSCITGYPTGQVKKSDSQTCRYDGQIYFHWYTILSLFYKRALFDLRFVHNLFWLKLKWNARSKLLYCNLYHLSFLHMKFKDIDKIKVAISETLSWTEISIFEI
jgi:hypothetical protein